MTWLNSIDFLGTYRGVVLGSIVGICVSFLFRHIHYSLGKRFGSYETTRDTAQKLHALGRVMVGALDNRTWSVEQERDADNLTTIAAILRAWAVFTEHNVSLCNRCDRIKVPTMGVKCGCGSNFRSKGGEDEKLDGTRQNERNLRPLDDIGYKP